MTDLIPTAGERLWGPYRFEIGSLLRPGKNEIRVRVANLINNSYGDIKESGLFGPVTVQTVETTQQIASGPTQALATP